MTILHVGCGRKKLAARELLDVHGIRLLHDQPLRVLHLDQDPRLEPDLVATLGKDRIPLEDDSVDLILAWHVLEHVGRQGEADGWFQCWEEIYRVLKPGGTLYGESPYYDSIWAWSDPTHSRVISEDCFAFFNQDAYRIPGNMISPYRIGCDFQWTEIGDLKGFRIISEAGRPQNRNIRFAFTARKPLRTWWEHPEPSLASIGQNGGVQ